MAACFCDREHTLEVSTCDIPRSRTRETWAARRVRPKVESDSCTRLRYGLADISVCILAEALAPNREIARALSRLGERLSMTENPHPSKGGLVGPPAHIFPEWLPAQSPSGSITMRNRAASPRVLVGKRQ